MPIARRRVFCRACTRASACWHSRVTRWCSRSPRSRSSSASFTWPTWGGGYTSLSWDTLQMLPWGKLPPYAELRKGTDLLRHKGQWVLAAAYYQRHPPLDLPAAWRGFWELWTSREPVGSVCPSTSAIAIIFREPSVPGGAGRQAAGAQGWGATALGTGLSSPARGRHGSRHLAHLPLLLSEAMALD